MKKIEIKVPAKINLTLDVLGLKGNYHLIDSLVTSVSVYDVITVKKRNDKRVTLKCKGYKAGCSTSDNNAYKAGKLFMNTFNTNGVSITVEKNIPVGAGMGGSSADGAGVLKAMNILYDVGFDMGELADQIGSDVRYMLNGGYAVLSGRGEKIEEKFIGKKLYYIIIKEDSEISSRACYKAFDKANKTYKPCTKTASEALLGGDFEKFCSVAKNDLYTVAGDMVKEISVNLFNLKRAGAKCVSMTGSGSAVFASFETKEQRKAVLDKIKKLYGNSILLAETIL